MLDSVPTQTKRRVVIALAAMFVGLTGFFILRRFEPTDSSYFPKCILHQLTGLHCPGCGATRALSALAHGRVLDAVRNNPLLVLGGPLIFVLVWLQRRRERTGGPASPRLSWTLFCVILVYFVGRNIPSPDRSWLAPPVVVFEQQVLDQ
jgi:hypothetical protein